MADDLLTVADFLADKLDVADVEVSDLLNDAPFFAGLPVVESSNGTTHKYPKETGAPVVGFRAENAGRDLDHSEDGLVTVNLKILDFSWGVDKAVADAWMRGGPEALIAREGRRHIRAAMYKGEEQYIQGTDAEASGFSGFADATGLDALADEMVLDAGGTGSNIFTSVYAVREGEDDVVGVVNGEGDGMMLGETIVQSFTDGSGKSYPAYYTPGCTWLGLQIGGARSVGRIANLNDTDAPLTDDLIYQLLELFPSSRQPTKLLMNRQSLRQLRASRTATNVTGAPAPRPTEVDGIPIQSVESISKIEAALS